MLVSIITVSLNSEKYIKDCIDSVNKQDYPLIEHILIDGDSNDQTLNVFKQKSKRRSKYISEKDNGLYDAMNKGIKLAKGDVIGFLNSDDFFFNPNVISKIVSEFKLSNVDATYGDLKYIDLKGNLTRKWISSKFLSGSFSKSWTPPHPTFYCKKELFELYGVFRTDFKIAADVELMLRFLELKKVSFSYIPNFIVTMRIGGISNSSILSTLVITKELVKCHKEHKLKFNLIKYLFFKLIKALKQKQF